MKQCLSRFATAEVGLAAACRDQMPYMWLTGWQQPDHNTLWRFYEQHRAKMRHLFKRTVRTAVKLGLIDLAVSRPVGMDGTKVAANASKARTHDVAGLKQMLERTEEAIRDLEAQNAKGEDPVPVHLPVELTRKQELCRKVKEAIGQLESEEGRKEINLTDEDASLMKSRQGIIAGYNAQVMVSPVKSEETMEKGFIITAADVVTDPDDHAQLVPVMEQAEEMTGKKADMTLSDGGYHSGPNLEECAQRGQVVAMPEAQQQALEKPYHKDRFIYNQEKDSYACPHAHVLSFVGEKNRSRAELPVRIYRGEVEVCVICPAFGKCTKDKRQGRALEISPHEDALRAHRAWMATEEAKAAYKLRKELPEPVFGILKEQRAARRFLLRGQENVRAEWLTLGTAFNLRTLWRFWRMARVTGPFPGVVANLKHCVERVAGVLFQQPRSISMTTPTAPALTRTLHRVPACRESSPRGQRHLPRVPRARTPDVSGPLHRRHCLFETGSGGSPLPCSCTSKRDAAPHHARPGARRPIVVPPVSFIAIHKHSDYRRLAPGPILLTAPARMCIMRLPCFLRSPMLPISQSEVIGV
ncbi:MAG: transposase [Chloroflexi bacterium]|nr:transposase [Chloroflexota bacterium]